MTLLLTARHMHFFWLTSFWTRKVFRICDYQQHVDIKGDIPLQCIRESLDRISLTASKKRWSQLVDEATYPLTFALAIRLAFLGNTSSFTLKMGAYSWDALGRMGFSLMKSFRCSPTILFPYPTGNAALHFITQNFSVRLRFPSTPTTLVVEILDSAATARHPKKRTIWRYSAETAGLNELNPENTEISDERCVCYFLLKIHILSPPERVSSCYGVWKPTLIVSECMAKCGWRDDPH